jgi:hypothetical protein
MQKENRTIQQILHNNGYDTPLRETTHNSKEKKTNREKAQWGRFTS